MANRKQRKGHRLPGPLLSLIENMATDFPTWSPKQIYDELTSRNREGVFKHPEVEEWEPELRTVQKIIKRARPADPSGTCEPTEWENGEDVALVLEVIKYLVGNGELIWPTRAEAQRILWIRQTAPTLLLELVWRLTRRYIIYESQQLPTKRLAWYLAFKPWESDANKELYFKMVPGQERVMHSVEGSGTLRGRMSNP
jgi:hypothetical protein